MRVTKKGVGFAVGSAVTLTTIMAVPVFAETTSAVVTNRFYHHYIFLSTRTFLQKPSQKP